MAPYNSSLLTPPSKSLSKRFIAAGMSVDEMTESWSASRKENSGSIDSVDWASSEARVLSRWVAQMLYSLRRNQAPTSNLSSKMF